MITDNLRPILLSGVCCGLLLWGCKFTAEDTRTFYRVPLVCETDPRIACGSRVKPLFMETMKQPEIKESWINRPGTVIALVWADNLTPAEKKTVIDPLFEEFEIEAELISDKMMKARLTESFFSNHAPTEKGKDKWYKGMDVDLLSLEEAGAIGDSATLFAVRAGLITPEEALNVKREIAEYMKTELVKVRTLKELTSDETDLKWKKQGYETYTKYIGTERAENVRDYYIEYQKKLIKKRPCCKTETSGTSEIKCPHCGYKKGETMPTDVCLLKYICTHCKKEILAKEGDCCVFCSYGDHKCPSMQDGLPADN